MQGIAPVTCKVQGAIFRQISASQMFTQVVISGANKLAVMLRCYCFAAGFLLLLIVGIDKHRLRS